MKKRILSLVLCAAMLLSMCLFMGAGVMDDTTAEGSAETTETVVSTSGAPEFQGVGPFMTYFPGSSTVRKAPMLRATAKDTSDGASNAVDVTKTATATDVKDAAGNPVYQIDLTAAAKSNIVTHTKACDIVLVLDRSGSMNFSLTGSDNNSKERVAALQTAVNAFLTTIQKSSPDSRVAIVSYASDVTIDSGTKTASGALIPVTADNTVNSALTQIVSGLSTRCDGGTQSGKGLQQAVNIFNSVSASDSNYDNTRVTVLFTDGKPGNNTWSGEDQGYDVAQQSVHWSTILKHAKGDTFNLQVSALRRSGGISKTNMAFPTIRISRRAAPVKMTGIGRAAAPRYTVLVWLCRMIRTKRQAQKAARSMSICTVSPATVRMALMSQMRRSIRTIQKK